MIKDEQKCHEILWLQTGAWISVAPNKKIKKNNKATSTLLTAFCSETCFFANKLELSENGVSRKVVSFACRSTLGKSETKEMVLILDGILEHVAHA